MNNPETPEPVVQRFRHKKRGTTYTLLGVGCVQGSLSDDDPAVIYRGEDGCLWVRPVAEFFDGRFEEVALRDETPEPAEEERISLRGANYG